MHHSKARGDSQRRVQRNGIPAIERAEAKGAHCDICRKIKEKTGEPCLPFAEHKQALLIEVNDSRDIKNIPELRAYLLKIKGLAEKDGFAGFAFVQSEQAKKKAKEVV